VTVENDDQAGPSHRQRKIIHVDMDAFYASVEQRDNPDLRGKPVAVGGSRERGVVAAASYEARKFGVRSAMPSVTAKRQCPDLIFVKPRFEVYREVSQQIREIFAEHTPIIEPLSLDEAYLDVTENLQGISLARDVALAIRAKIKEVTGLNASAGISYNKFLAKLASDHRKPNGQYVITPEMGPPFVETLPVGKFHGIGPATSAKMNALGLYTGLDMRNQSLEFMQANFGKAGSYYYWISRGVDNREVRADRVRKSIGAENTFFTDLTEFEAMVSELQPLIDKVWRHCEDKGTRGRTVTLKVKFADFELISRSRTLVGAVCSRSEFENVSIELSKALFPMQKAVRLLGVSISGFKFDEIRGSEQIALALLVSRAHRYLGSFTPGSEPGGCRMSMVSWLRPAWIQAFFAAAIHTSSGGGMSSRIRRCSRSFAARSHFTVSIGTTSATVKVCLAFTFVQLDHNGRCWMMR
jgi:DNA polymerase-4